MSITKEITIWCEAFDCVRWTQIPYNETAGSITRARKVAKRWSGWGVRNGKDYCGTHYLAAPKETILHAVIL